MHVLYLQEIYTHQFSMDFNFNFNMDISPMDVSESVADYPNWCYHHFTMMAKKTDYLPEVLLLLYMIRKQQISADSRNLISDYNRPWNVLFYEYNGIILFDEFEMPFTVHDFFHLDENSIISKLNLEEKREQDSESDDDNDYEQLSGEELNDSDLSIILNPDREL